ncbi:U2 small nuclear ribonucleoprotein auxiliary factor 35 kDa subunit-related protein 2-like [Haliotis cracherodii]|uniref:U2 small nuclear ribonucleoprotein auxiliary factor 35 kDa subunit-related protein 2-like n=1 Tax=Haliotis cracherodii TaxID=6455 RepID=UPI0039EB3D61
MALVNRNDKTTEICPTQKMSHRKWKAMMRKQKRRAKRQEEDQQKSHDKVGSLSESEDEAALQAQEEERQRQHQLWLEREKEAEEEWLANKEREKKEVERRLEVEQKIREEWEERQKKEKEEEEEREKIDREKKEKQAQLLQQATASDNKDAWHNPIAPMMYGKDRDECPFFMKTGACRFAERCSRSHTYPESSCTIMLPGMFANFRLEQSLVDENDTDLALEYDDSELYENFMEFYNDVLPEFRSMGRVIQFKVSCNCEPHLRGNVYVQYRREDDAQKAFVKFNGRWYGGRQISCIFINIAKWKSAICGLAFVKRCPKGKSCNFLHVFRNPGNEFWLADKDYEMSERDHRSSDRRDSRHRYGSDRRDRYSHRDRFDHDGRDHSYDNRYKSRRHDRSRSRSRSPKSKRGNRSRSRSPSRSRRKRSRSRSRKSRSPSRSIRHRSGSRSPQSRRSKLRKSRSPVSPEANTKRHYKSDSRSPSRSSKRTSRSKSHRSRSPSHSMENVRSSSNGQSAFESNGTNKAKNTDSSSDSDSETSKSHRSDSKTKHKKSKKHKKHKHKSHKKKNSEKYKPKTKVSPISNPHPESVENHNGKPIFDPESVEDHNGKPINDPECLDDHNSKSISDPESLEDHNGKPNIIEIPQGSDEEDLGDVIFEDVYV